MAKPTIVTRAGKGSALTWTEGDSNLTNLQNATIKVAGDSGDSQAIDLNDTVTISGGTGLSSATTTKTVTLNLDNTAVTAGSYTKASVTVDAQGRITAASNGSADFATADARTAISVTDAGGDGSLEYNNTTGVIKYTGPSASDVRAHFSAGTGITLTDGAIATTITQYTDSAARSAVSVNDAGGEGSLEYNNTTGVIKYTGPSFSGLEVTSAKNQANGYAGLDAGGKVASAQLPSYVDDVEEYADKPAFPVTGETSKIYVALDNGKIYRWSGSAYVEISASPGSTDSVTEGSTNLYFTTQRARDSFSASTGITITSGAIATTITQYTDSNARSAISVTDAGGDGSLSYNNTTGVITYTGPSAAEVRAHVSAGTGISITDGAISSTITQYTDAGARAAVSVTDSGGDGSLSYSSATGVITYTGPGTTDYRAAFTAGTGITITSGAIATTITQYTDTNARNALSGSTGISYNSTTGAIAIADTAVTPASYTYASITVDAQGRITAASNGTAPLVSGGALGTPSSGTLTNATGLPIGTGVSGLGTNVATALAVNVGSSGALVTNGGALGTPSSGTVTNLTGTASININGTVGATTPAAGTFTTLTVNAANDLRLSDSDSSNYVGFKAPTTVSANKIWTLPSADGTSGQVLSTDGSATLSWATAGGGGGPSMAIITMASPVNVSGTTYRTTFTEVSDPSNIITLADSNRRITLAAGTYTFEGDFVIYTPPESQPSSGHLIYSTTSSTTLVDDFVSYFQPASTNTFMYWVNKTITFTLANSATIEYRFTRSNSFYLNQHLTVFRVFKLA